MRREERNGVASGEIFASQLEAAGREPEDEPIPENLFAFLEREE
jgi:hypothetical protein